MSKLLFLDIDGVMNSHDLWRRNKDKPKLPENRWTDQIDPEACRRMERVVAETGCKIIISSTWRIIHPLAALRGFFLHHGWRAPIVGKTPRLGDFRGDEVAKFISEWRDPQAPYVCIDDDGDFHPHQPLVKTSYAYGLTDELAQKAIDILNAEATSDSAASEATNKSVKEG